MANERDFLILRYIVEPKHTATFTASKNVLDEVVAKGVVRGFIGLNKKAGYMKYSNFILYDQNNKVVKIFNGG